jgi:hypothetical protein
MGSSQFDQKILLSLGNYRINGSHSTISMVLFAGHFVDQKRKGTIVNKILVFTTIN